MNKRNYQKELEKLIDQEQKDNKIPSLFLHSCCAPCSSYVLEYLSKYFNITVFYYNPNIYPEEEYRKRVHEITRLVNSMEFEHPVKLIEGYYDPQEFFQMAKGLEDIPEGGERCFKCYRLRMEEAAKLAEEGGYDYFTTTLSISPLKNAAKINEIGEELAEIYHVQHLPSDFKKKNGYKRSIELSHEYDLYRQNYCGCVYSRREAENRKKSSNHNYVTYSQYPVKKKKVCWGAFEGSCNSWYSGICVMSRPSHVSERSLQRSEFERAAYGFSRFPNALESQGSETKPQHTFFFFTYLLNDSKLTTLQY